MNRELERAYTACLAIDGPSLIKRETSPPSGNVISPELIVPNEKMARSGNAAEALGSYGAPGTIRTSDPQIRSFVVSLASSFLMVS